MSDKIAGPICYARRCTERATKIVHVRSTDGSMTLQSEIFCAADAETAPSTVLPGWEYIGTRDLFDGVTSVDRLSVVCSCGELQAICECEHNFDEDCMNCAVCGECSESLNDDDVCAVCRATDDRTNG